MSLMMDALSPVEYFDITQGNRTLLASVVF